LTTRRLRGAILALGLLGALLGAGAAFAADPAGELAQRYSPVVRLVAQTHECGPGEPYEPSDVNAFLGQETVALRGPWRSNDLIKVGPTAADLGRGLYGYNLDFPGSPLDPGCDYERWARMLTAAYEPTVYAHVATEAAKPGKLALQYWLWYPFNRWNNNHEGDWEMIQLVFDAPDAEAALAVPPVEVGYSQHEGAEKAAWGDDKLELVDGTHPVVYPAAGSHANFFGSALYIGRSAEEGIGCDDTTGPSRELLPVVKLIPSDPAAARKAFPWIEFQGRWGERQPAFLNGPTGPNLKTQWTEPITWSEGWRDYSVAVPAGGLLGTDATDTFCGAVAAGSNLVVALARNPPLVIGVVAALAILVVVLARRTSWRPTAPLRVARRRSWGQTLTAAGRMYGSHLRLFLGIGLVTLPISLVITGAQALLFRASSLAGLPLEGEDGGWRVGLGVAIGTVLTLLGLAIVQAATARAVVEIDAGRPVSTRRVYRLAAPSAAPLLGALAVAVAVVTLLATSIFLLPFAIWLALRWALLVPAVELENETWRGALRRSGALVRRQWFKVGTLVVVAAGLAIAAGPVLGALLLFIPSAPPELINVVAGVVYAFAMPFVGLTTVYVYFDTLVRERLAPQAPAASELPAEIALG
jgi:hypothetical protein